MNQSRYIEKIILKFGMADCKGRVLSRPVVGRSRPAVITCRTVCSGVFHHWIHHLRPQGAVPQGFNPLQRVWVYGAPKRGMPTGSEALLELPVAWGFGPATGPTLKTALCHIRTLVGCRINNGMFFPKNTPESVLDFGPERGSAKGTMADLGPLGT